jgi:hypothetical protein
MGTSMSELVDWSQEIRIQCKNCGGFDFCTLDGVYKSKHECEALNTNQLLLRIAKALEVMNGSKDCACG